MPHERILKTKKILKKQQKNSRKKIKKLAEKIKQSDSKEECSELIKAICKYNRTIGIGQKTGIDIPGESKGLLTNYKYWDKSMHFSMGYGYGASVTPIQMASAISAIAQNSQVELKREIEKNVENIQSNLSKSQERLLRDLQDFEEAIRSKQRALSRYFGRLSLMQR